MFLCCRVKFQNNKKVLTLCMDRSLLQILCHLHLNSFEEGIKSFPDKNLSFYVFTLCFAP